MLTPRPRRHVSVEEALAELQQVADAQIVTRPTGQDIQPASGKGWLDGVRILDLTNVIAGPHSTAFLSRFGAEVIKLDPVTPLYDPLIGTLFAFQTGVSKKSALVDITSDQGREAFNRLVRSVDIVVINAPERQMKPLGLDHESLQAVHPGVIFCRLDCLGGPRRGPKTDYIGYDDNHSGQQRHHEPVWRSRYPGGTRPPGHPGCELRLCRRAGHGGSPVP